MKKITLTYIGKRGAGNNYSLEMTKELLKQNCEVQCVLSKYIGNINDWKYLSKEFPTLQLLFIETYTSKIGFIYSLTSGYIKYAKVRKEIKRFNPDILYIPMLSLLNFYLLPTSIPVITTIHDVEQHLGEKSRLVKFLYNKTIKKSSKIIVLSQKFVNEVHQKYNIEKKNISLIPHACFKSYLPANYTPNFQSIHKRILFFGRIYPYKGLEVLLQALVYIRRNIPDIQLRIAGNGDISNKEKHLIAQLKDNIDLHIEWIKDKDIEKIIKDVDMVILPYIEASQSGVIPLSYSFGKMVIATDVGGLSEQIYDNTGFLIRPNDINELVNLITSLYKTPNIIIEKNKNAFYVAHNILTWEHSASTLLSVIK